MVRLWLEPEVHNPENWRIIYAVNDNEKWVWVLAIRQRPPYDYEDLGGAVFHNVHLGQAKFEDVNLSGASIRNANLENFSIEDAYIAGMTIFGLRVDLLISAELDRRDPERVRLRMSDPYDPECVRRVMQRLEEVRRLFRETLLAAEPGLLTPRPAPDQWSAVEIVRHLLYAEDLFLNRRILGNAEPWNRLGLLPDFLIGAPAYAGVGSEPTDDLDKILEAWEALHARIRHSLAEVTVEQLRSGLRDLAYGQGTVGGVLQGMAQHDLLHIRQAEAALSNKL